MRISDWSSDVCSSDLRSLLVRRATGILTGVSKAGQGNNRPPCLALRSNRSHGSLTFVIRWNERHAYCKLWRYSRPESSNLLFFDQSIGPNYDNRSGRRPCGCWRSEEHTSELPSLMRISYAVFCLKNKRITKTYRV